LVYTSATSSLRLLDAAYEKGRAAITTVDGVTYVNG